MGLVYRLMLVGLPAVLEAIAVPVHFQDVDMVSEAIEECSGQPFRAKDLGPLVEGQVGFRLGTVQEYGSNRYLMLSSSRLPNRHLSPRLF